MKELQAVIFDMDGVIIDSEPIYFDIERKLFKKLNIEISKKEHHSFVGMTMEGMWEKIISQYNLEHKIDELIKLHEDSIFHYMTNAQNLPMVLHVKELIKLLSKEKVKIAVASSSPKKLIEIILEKLNITEFFDYIVSGEEVENGKPNPDIFLHTAEKLNVNPKKCVVVEDSRNGVSAAKSADMKCIGFKNINSGNQDLSQADLIVDSIGDINIEILEDLVKE
ncbi:HAD family hydrolase [Thermohalobacter berrensis]|uniref:Phosphatase n=1 Tax=Thermohalobacter berrensis TaxID=99594 RepID=A0A419T299_9FIRM|nr:HAD family hydrolase [Thermohalobacter berrensis]RKD31572.1 phosphatase [Thermohalobacter berrensis]